MYHIEEGRMSIDTTRIRSRPIRLLLVEDNKGDVILFRRAFGNCNIPLDITVARTGEEMLQLLDERPGVQIPDIIVLDLNLPGLSGHQALRAIKADERLRRIPVFILSSSLAESDVTSCYDAHANCYIVKPYGLENLSDIAKRIGQFWFSLAVLPDTEPATREMIN